MFFVRERGYKPDLSGSGPLRHLSAKMRSSMSVNSNLNQAYSAKNPWNQSFPTMVFARVVKSIESMGGTETVRVAHWCPASHEHPPCSAACLGTR